MNLIKSFFSFIARLVTSGAAKRALNRAAEIAPDVLPYIALAAEIVAGITPSQIDDVLLAAIKAKYPQLFNGSLKTADEVKLFTLGVAGDLVQAKFPGVSTSIARSAVQAIYLAEHPPKTSEVPADA